MKIGILTMHRVHNYGSFMQSYSLKSMLESTGTQCVFLDIKPTAEKISELGNKSSLIYKMMKLFKKDGLKRFSRLIYERRMHAIFENTLLDELNVNSIMNDEKCDMVVIGSDEVFSCVQDNGNCCFRPQLFGSGILAERVISYAASFGKTTYDDISRYGLEDQIKKSLENLYRVSVRDDNSYSIVERIMGSRPYMNLDPALLGDYIDRIRRPKIKDYIAVYAYSDRINSEVEIEQIRSFAKKEKKKLIGVGMYQFWCDKNVMGDPFEILGYIQQASYVITDTFHGCVFSIKLNKSFAVYIRDTNRNKIVDLLRKLSLQEREICLGESLDSIMKRPIDYARIENYLSEERNRSYDYINETICGLREMIDTCYESETRYV